MSRNRVLGSLAAITAAGLFCVGCENTARGAKQDARENAAAAKQGAERAEESASHAAEKAKDAASETLKDVGASADAAKQTLDVKTALIADKTIDAAHIDVDTDATTKTVYLRGSVPSAAQKDAAERVARRKAEGYGIKNELAVAAR